MDNFARMPVNLLKADGGIRQAALLNEGESTLFGGVSGFHVFLSRMINLPIDR